MYSQLILELLLKANINQVSLKCREIRKLLKIKTSTNKALLWQLSKKGFIDKIDNNNEEYTYTINASGIFFLANHNSIGAEML